MPVMNQRVKIGAYMLAFILLVDQLSKWWIVGKLADVETTIPVTSFLNFVLAWNKGVTFGIMNHGEHLYLSYVLIAVALGILFLLGRWLWRTDSTPVAIALGAIMGGALGNVVDRLHYGAVVDFIDFYYEHYHWYAFNIADAAVVTGVALLLLDGMVRGK